MEQLRSQAGRHSAIRMQYDRDIMYWESEVKRARDETKLWKESVDDQQKLIADFDNQMVRY